MTETEKLEILKRLENDDDYYGDGNANGSRNNLQQSKGKNQNNLNYSG